MTTLRIIFRGSSSRSTRTTRRSGTFLAMRSGIPDLPDIMEPLPTATEFLKTFTDVRHFPAGSRIEYSNTNFELLEPIIETIARRPIEEVLPDDILNGPGLGALRQTANDSIEFDGVGESDSASLARWGFQLYGGSVLSDASLREMTDFRGDWYGLGAVDYSRVRRSRRAMASRPSGMADWDQRLPSCSWRSRRRASSSRCRPPSKAWDPSIRSCEP